DPQPGGLRPVQRPGALEAVPGAPAPLSVRLLGGRRLVRPPRRLPRAREPGPPAGPAAGDHRAVRLAAVPTPLTGGRRTMWVGQPIHPSLSGGGGRGYPVAARPPGVAAADVAALTAWSPSQEALIVDDANRTSLQLHPLPSGRLALSRTCQGPAEYSGRGGRQ